MKLVMLRSRPSKQHGIAMIEAYPFKSEDSQDPGDHYLGSLPMFIVAGFAVTGESPEMTIVRKSLA